MRKGFAVALAFACVLSVGCGGSSSGGGDDCSKIGSRLQACDPEYYVASEVASQCRDTTCTGDRQAAIDCVLAVQGCSLDALDEANACLDAQGCSTTIPEPY